MAVAGMFALVACGSGVDQAEQARLDSLMQDSIMKAQADSIAAVEQIKADSIANAMAADTTAVVEEGE